MYKQGPLAKFASQALLMDTVRGVHSTGVFVADQKDYFWYKRAIPGYDFINTSVFSRINKQSHDFFIGHNRAATMGSIVDETAHPFEVGDWVGVHNGTLKYGWEKDLGKGFVNDSEAIINSVDKHGLKDTCELLDGAFSLVLYSIADHKLYFARNDERPMMIVNCGDQVFFGSEEHIVKACAVRNGFTVNSVSSTRVGTIYSIDDQCNIKMEEDFKPLEKKPAPLTFPSATGRDYGGRSTSTSNKDKVGKSVANLGTFLGYRTKDIVTAYFTDIIPWGQKQKEFKLVGFIDDDDLTPLSIFPFNEDDASTLKNYPEALRVEIREGVAYWQGKQTAIGKLADPIPEDDVADKDKCAMCDGAVEGDTMMTQGSMPVCQECCEAYGWVV